MPVVSWRSRAAKKRQREGQSGFAKWASASSPDGSVYCLSDGQTDASTIDTNSSNDKGRDNQAAVSMDGLQHLYSIFLPLNLQLNEDHQEKCQKTSKRSAVFTGNSQTTAWRRSVAQRKVAEGCAMLDTFVQRKGKVGSKDPD